MISLLKFLDQGLETAPVCTSIKILGFDNHVNRDLYIMAMKAHVIGGLWHIIIRGLSFLSICKVLINNIGCLTREVDRK